MQCGVHRLIEGGADADGEGVLASELERGMAVVHEQLDPGRYGDAAAE